MSFLIQAYLQLQEVSGNEAYLIKAKELAAHVISHYSDEENLLFYFTPREQQDVIIRKKEIYDGATASGNSQMCANLYYLSVIFDIPKWRERAMAMVKGMVPLFIKYPTSFASWILCLQWFLRTRQMK